MIEEKEGKAMEVLVSNRVLATKLAEVEVPVPMLGNGVHFENVRTFKESQSPTLGELAGALAIAQGEMSNGAKDKQGYGYKYMTLDSLTDIIRPELSKNGLAIIQTHEFVNGSKPSVVTHTTILHKSGEWFKSSLELPIKVMSQLSQAQMIGICCTYGRRYTLQSICLVASEEDTDASSK